VAFWKMAFILPILKIAVFAASVLSSVIGVAVLWSAPARKTV